ncbi:hypothetical protein [Oceanirhabdus seepicola]|uniref:Uncharacterized protein n=1 Tax=Oceanirhabdus seepicola TaxID=2828781 RepID=A0A9J6PAF1_9CLOT|nr:hypothetical protein [Oceanirhabdus seepicola]MCM1992697.1 hypothetical protein [Oceanirhabdus seepicola]
MSKSRSNAKKDISYKGNNTVNGKTDYPLARDPKHNKQEPTKGLPKI